MLSGTIALWVGRLSLICTPVLCSPSQSYMSWNQVLRLDFSGDLPGLRVLDNYGSAESHILVFDTGVAQSFFPNSSRPEPEVTLLLQSSTAVPLPLLGPNGHPVAFILDGGGLNNRPTLAAGKLTSFSNTFGTFMLVPSISNSWQLVFDPITPDYCIDENPIYVTTSNFDRMIRTRIDVVDNNEQRISRRNASDFFEISSGSRWDLVPESIFEAIVDSVESSGAGIVSNETLHFSNCTVSRLSLLPTLAFSFSNHDGPFDARIELHMFPEDYVEVLDDGYCELRVRPSGESRMLGLNFLSNIAVHFDDVNDQVGFCDPIRV